MKKYTLSYSKITKGAKLIRSTIANALPLFLPRPENSRKNNLSKIGFWEQFSDKPLKLLASSGSDPPLFGTDWRP